MVGATAPGSLKDAGQFIRLRSGGALVGDDRLGGGWFIGCKGRGPEEKEENRGGESFHGNLLRVESSRGEGGRGKGEGT